MNDSMLFKIKCEHFWAHSHCGNYKKCVKCGTVEHTKKIGNFVGGLLK